MPFDVKMAKNHSQGRRLVFSQAKILAKATLRERFSQIVLRAFPIYAVFSSSLLSLSSTKRLFFFAFSSFHPPLHCHALCDSSLILEFTRAQSFSPPQILFITFILLLFHCGSTVSFHPSPLSPVSNSLPLAHSFRLSSATCAKLYVYTWGMSKNVL